MAVAVVAAAAAPARGPCGGGAAAVVAAAPAAQAFLIPQRRHYTPPSRRTWAKQHHRIRIPRPMVDGFDLSREQPQKQWWRERRIAPATFFGFPDVTQQGLRGGSLYVEQMDSVTLAVLADKCVKESVVDPEIWGRFCWRAQQLACRMHEPDLCYIFRAFSRADWFDQNFLTTYLGRLHRRLHAFQLPDVAVLLEAFANRKFRQSTYLQKALTHLTLLLQHRDDAKPEDLARACAALRELSPLSPALAREVRGALELLAEALLLRDLSELGATRAVKIVHTYVDWGLVSRDIVGRASASADLCWALVRELKGQLRELGREHPDELARLALALADGGLDHEDLWEELTHNLHYEAHRLSGAAAASAVLGAAKAGRCAATLHKALARRLQDTCPDLSASDCARAAGGLLRGPRSVAEKAVLKGPIFDRCLELGLDSFDAASLTLLLDSLARTSPGAFGVETMAGATLEALHSEDRLHELTARQLASVVRSLARLRPAVPDVLADVLNRAQAAATEALEECANNGDDGGMAPRHVAMLYKGIASQPSSLVPDVPARLQALLPQVAIALDAQPAATTAAVLFGSLLRCPASPERDAQLGRCTDRLRARMRDLAAIELVNLCEELPASGSGSWTPPAHLIQDLTRFLDMKRYDLAPGVLHRAAQALERAGAAPGALRLEARDQPQDVDAQAA
eukprot:TRINITY_DN2944_c0_g1_i1.p1 TRINITY_DN2944_c0_g1~~TRINITY_DN2944_c0_g1_i1.p1  ORF type:complete len:694 (-),score=169.71 TRINITY_DN2944_c0_g1_i1:131-2191(-)